MYICQMAKITPTRVLQRRLMHFFTPGSIQRGDDYFHSGAVMNVKNGRFGASAEVVGSGVYRVFFDWSQTSNLGIVGTYCTCPHFAEQYLCKHLWAFALELDRQGIPKHIPFPRRLEAMLSRKEPEIGDLVEVGEESPNPKTQPTQPSSKAEPSWRRAFQRQSKMLRGLDNNESEYIEYDDWEEFESRWPQNLTLFAVLEAKKIDAGNLKVKFYASQLTSAGTRSQPKAIPLPDDGDLPIPDQRLRSMLRTLATLARANHPAVSNLGRRRNHNRYKRSSSWMTSYASDPFAIEVSTETARIILPGLLETGIIYASKQDFMEGRPSLKPAKFGDFKLVVEPLGSESSGYAMRAKISPIELGSLELFAEPNLYRHQNLIGFIDLSEGERAWVKELIASGGHFHIPEEDVEAFLEAAANQSVQFEVPPELNWERLTVNPSAHLELTRDWPSGKDRYLVDLRFHYGNKSISLADPIREVVSGVDKHIYSRNFAEEERLHSKLPTQYFVSRQNDLPTVHAKHLYAFVTASLQEGFPVNVESQNVRASSDFRLTVSTGLDWFDLEGQAEFGGRWVKFPAILDAVRKGENFIPLEDGSMALIDEEMTNRLKRLSAFAESKPDGLRFGKSQWLLLTSLLETETHLNLDEKFMKLREKARSFSGISPRSPSASFSGELRTYQKEGLGWLEFLDEYGLGGILADDMGLGKTIQCLAFLEKRRQQSAKTTRAPSLLIAPKSLLQNWKMEAEKFTPQLAVHIHAGTDRGKGTFSDQDLVVTTYQTMLRDIEWLREIQWDCLILDEAQAIKNSEALVAKAAKLFSARFRLAMTGTPIENSINDLFSISDFVNPGFLSAKKAGFKSGLNETSRTVLGQAFKPVILRRTKEQVLKDLPEKTEQVISVELEAKQLKTYNELKRFYQHQLLKKIESEGIKRSQMQILAALTRLRQAALHPALIDSQLSNCNSSKFEAVLSMLDEIVAEKHRVLIFSQFTSLLALLKKELEHKKIEYAYLDGKTTKRQKVVDGFKNSDCPVFLMSLKAGGVGLNLVEADYVFLMDPWWNPAVEAQAIDRVHRIGQKRAVNAYRFIAKNTVEEKILELQKTKKGISAEIIDEKSSLVRNLTAEDIANLLA